MITPAHTSGKPRNQWVYLAPHLDDIAMSCGGLVWEQVQSGDAAAIWTICAGDPPPGRLSPFAALLHERWETSVHAVHERRMEDLASCQELLAEVVHFSVPDCIYRRSPINGSFLYASEESLWQPVHPDEDNLIQDISLEIADRLEPGARLVAPLAIGLHIDHRLTRAAAELLGRPLWYYADYPYVMNNQRELQRLQEQGWQAESFSITPAGLAAWQAAIAAHPSQISTFWDGLPAMQEAIREYAGAAAGVQSPGIQLWRAGV